MVSSLLPPTCLIQNMVFITNQVSSHSPAHILNLCLKASSVAAYELKQECCAYTFVSENITKITGYQPHELLENRAFWFNCIHPEDQATITATFKATQIGDRQSLRYRLRHKEGHYCWIQDDFRTLEHDGEAVILGSWLDITEQENLRQAVAAKEQEVAQAQQFTEEILEAIACPLYIKDQDYRYIYSNAANNRLLGLSEQAILGKTDYELFPSAQADIFRVQDLTTRAGELIEPIEEIITNPQGEKHSLWTTKSTFTVDQEYLFGMGLDITEQQQTKKYLDLSIQRLQKLTNNVPGMIYQFLRTDNGEYAFTQVSQYCEELFGYSPAEILANSNLVFDTTYPDDAEGLFASIDAAIQHNTDWQYEWRTISPQTGKIKWLRGTSEATNSDQLAKEKWVWDGILLDISDRKKAEAQQSRTRSIQTTVIQISQTLLKGENTAFNSILQQLGTVMQANRAFLICHNNPERGSLVTNEWFDTTKSTSISQYFEKFEEIAGSWWFTQLSQGNHIICNDLATLPPEA
ncbi:MAG: PAS domain-containing protein, partial [Limnothrix sp.]